MQSRRRAITPRLLAIDLDGTLVRDDGHISIEDRRAIAALLAAGVAVSIATGRIASGALPIARELGLSAPLICADGAVLVGIDGAPMRIHGLSPAAQRALLDRADPLGLCPFLFTHDAIHAGPSAAPLWPWVRGWSPDLDVSARAALASIAAELVILALAIGSLDAVKRGLAEITPALGASLGASTEADIMPLGSMDLWALRMRPARAQKGQALIELAAILGVPRSNVAFIGDGYNDMSAMQAAAASFCMGHAPHAVKRAAGRVVEATSLTGGGIAEAARLWPSPLNHTI